jgi:cytoskeletal protein CcmA (bactofilin family)
MSFTSTAAPAAEPGSVRAASEAATVIDANTVVDGMLSTSHDLRVDGRVTGTLMCDGVLHVAEGAEVDATVEAAGIVVAGSLSGAITCHGRLEIRATGTVRGRVETGRLIVVEGAVYEGQLRMDAAPTDDAPAPELDAEPDEQEPEPAPPGQATGSYSFLRSFAPGTAPPRPADDVLPASPDEEEPE